MLRPALILALVLAAGSSAFAQEDDEAMEVQRCIWRCMHHYGVESPQYGACVSQQCDNQPAPQRKKQAPAQSSAAPLPPEAPGTWGYGKHPRFGLSAYVDIGHNAFGLSCDTDPNVGWSVAIKMTPGLVPLALQTMKATAVFDGPFSLAGTQVFEYNSGGYLQQRSDFCTSNIDRLKASQALIFLDAPLKSLTYLDGVTTMEVTQDGRTVAIAKTDDMKPLTGSVEVPLKGAGTALDRLIQSCPKLIPQVAEGCEID
jgi:hypothetical protein